MKKLIAVLLMIIVLISFVGCSSKKTKVNDMTENSQDTQVVTEDNETTSKSTTKVVGFINAGPDDYYAQFGDAFKKIADLYGLKVIEVNSEYSPEKELANVQDMIAKKVDAIAVITASAAGSASSVTTAQDAGIPIFFIAGKPVLDPGTELTGHVSDNYVMIAYMLGQWVSKNYPDAKCAMIPGFLGQGPAEAEIVGFQMALEEAGMKPAKILASGEWQRSVTIPIIQDFIASGEDFDVLFAGNEEMAYGAVQVFDELGVKDKIVISNNGKEDGWPLLEDGSLTAVGLDPPSLSADLCVQQIVHYLNGEKFETYLEIKPSLILTKDNLSEAIPWKMDSYLKKRAENGFVWKLEDYEKSYIQNKEDFEKFNAAVQEYMENN